MAYTATFYAPSKLEKIEIAGFNFVGSYAGEDAVIPENISQYSVISEEILTGRINSTTVLGLHKVFASGITVNNTDANDKTGVNGTVLNSNNYTFIAGSTFSNNLVTGTDNGGNYARGGVIFTQQKLYIDKSTDGQSTVFSGNTANGRGGAIYAGAGGLYISGTTFSGNRSLKSYAGALFVSGNVNSSIQDTLFIGNTAAEEAGAIYVYMSTTDTLIEITGSTFHGNIAKKDGGAVYGYKGKISISGSTFATDKDTIYTTANASLEFSGHNVLNANVTAATAISVENGILQFDNTSALTISNMVFSGEANSLIFSGTNTVTFSNQILTDVAISIEAAFTAGTLTVASGIDSGLAATVSVDGYTATVNGAGFLSKVDSDWLHRVTSDGSNLVLQSSDTVKIGYDNVNGFDSFATYDDFLAANYGSFTGNIDENGAVNATIYAAEKTNRIIINDTVYSGKYAGNTMPENILEKSAIYGITSSSRSVISAQSVIDRSTFSGSVVEKLNGAALNLTQATNIYGCTFDGNKTSGIAAENSGSYARGGAIWSSADLTVKSSGETKSVFNNNQTMGLGGAIYMSKGNLTVENAVFTGNKSLNQGGGAIYTSSDTATVTGTRFENNTVSANGGAIFAIGTVTVTDCVFSGNRANLANRTYYGGAIYVHSGTTNIANSSFETDSDTVYVNSGTLNISGNNTFNASVCGNGNFNVTDAVLTFGNTAAIEVAAFNFSGSNAINLNGEVVNFAALDAEQVAITVDGALYSGSDTVVATGVTGTLGDDDKVNGGDALYLEIVGSDLVLKQNVIVADGTSGNLGKGDGKDVVVNIAVDATYGATVRAGSASGTDSVIKSTVTGGTFNNNLYGGGLVSAAKTDITVSGTTEVKQILYGGIFVKEKESATDLGESNLTVAGGVFNHNVVGGSRVDVNENAQDITHTTAKVNLTISGGTFAKTGTKTDPGVAVYSAGYVNGRGEKEPASTGYDYKVNENTVVINGGVEIKGAVYGGVFACQGGKAYVGSVSISVANAKVDRILGGGWAQTGGKSDVGTVSINLGIGAQVGIVYAGGGNAKVGNTEVFGKVDETIKDVAITVDGGDVGEIFMGGRYNKSVVTGAVVVTINSEADSTISRISGKNGYGVRLENAGRTELVVNSGLTVGMLDSVDKLTIAEGKTLTLGSAEFTGMDVCLELGTNGFDGTEWDVLSGISLENLTQAEFFIGGSQLTFDDNGVYTGNDFKLELKDNKLTMLAKA